MEYPRKMPLKDGEDPSSKLQGRDEPEAPPMLVEFSVANYLSFKDRVTLSLVASNDTEHEENTFLTPGRKPLRLLKSVGIYGANASGKSNLMKALRFANYFVRESAAEQPGGKIAVVPFKLDPETSSLPSEFEIVFIDGDQRYTYSFSADSRRVHKESLTAARLSGEVARERLLFERSPAGKYRFGSTWRGDAEKVKRMTRGNALFLSVAAQFNNPIAEPIVEWFGKKFTGIHEDPERGGERAMTATLAAEKPEFAELLADFLRVADPSIARVALEVRPAAQASLFADLPRSEAPERFAEGVDSDDVELIEVKTIHLRSDESEVRLDLHGEGSDGTRRMFDLYGPLAYVWLRGALLCVDEIESKLHPLLTRSVVSIFHRSEKSQLVFTTHDCGLLDADLFRRDQIWFTEKDSAGATHLYSLWDYKVRKDENYGKGYLAGRYGAIPFVGGFQFEGN